MDETIIFRIKSGDLMVLDKIYLEIKPKFFTYARRQFPNVQLEDVQDIYQDSIIVFYQNIRRGALTEITSNLSSYIIQIGKIKLIQHSNKFNRHVDLQLNFSDQLPKDGEYDSKIDQAVKFIFSKMSDSCKQILNLFYFEKKSMEEIAFLLNYKNANTVKSKKSRCISAFNTNVNKMYFDEE